MNNVKKFFLNYNMTWLRVILFAVITAVVTAVLNELKFLNDTSFQDIAIAFECWFLFAVFIIVNCETWWEASLKTFVFFLISQPLIYLIEVPFEPGGWEVFMYYKHWFLITVLTLPGAAVAFLVKKQKWYSVPVLSVATGYLAYAAVMYIDMMTRRFPHHLLSCVFCIALAVFFILVLFDKKSLRISSFAVTAAAFAAGLYYYFH